QEIKHQQALQQAEIDRLNQEIANLTSERVLMQQFIERLPELAESMPDVERMNVLQFGEGEDRMSTFVAQQFAVIRALRDFLNGDNPDSDSSAGLNGHP
ncbi:MAG: hypothetical protein AAFR22_21205, partial [Chloroflexota bacterium]